MPKFFRDLEINSTADLRPDPDRMLDDLKSRGIAVAHLGEAATRAALYELGAHMGKPMVEASPMRELAYRGVVLRTDDIGYGEPLGMHVDLALLPPDERPDATMLGCNKALPPRSGSDTLLCAMAKVAASLTDRDREVLAVSKQELANDGGVGSTPILTERRGYEHLSYWSMGPYGETWTLNHPEEVTPQEADDAVARLESGMDDPEHVRRIPWEPGLVVAWDNGRYLHSRTAREPDAKDLPRVIYRVRLSEVEALAET